MSPQLPLLSLPPELRAQIYRSYLSIEDGYLFNFETGKLKANNNNQPINLAATLAPVWWKSTTKIGIASATDGKGTYLTVARYAPAGDFVGQKPC